MAIAPVEALEGVVVEAGDIEETAMGGGVGGAEDLSVVEDDGLYGAVSEQTLVPGFWVCAASIMGDAL